MPARRTESTLRQFLIATDAALVKELRTVVEDTSTELKQSFEGVVKNWKTKIKFRRVMKYTSTLIEGRVQAVGATKKIWQYVDEGTKPHDITPKGDAPLRFQTGYSPRTRPRMGNTPPAGNVGSGTSSGAWVSTRKVHHPGTKPRQFAKTFEANMSPSFQWRIEAAIRRAVRRAV